MAPSKDPLETRMTLEAGVMGSGQEVPRIFALTIMAHPDPRRVASWMPLDRAVALGRDAPTFDPHGAVPALALDDPFVSRKPVHLTETPSGGWRIDASQTRTALLVDGVPCRETMDIAAARLDEGVVLQLAGRIALLFRRERLDRPMQHNQFGLIGHSTGIETVRQAIVQVADVHVPVLIRGESGVGKELVARGLHAAGPRAGKPYEVVNMASLPAHLAASELFGAEKGAFTGATSARAGFFARTDSGTLFLDEVGDTPLEVQPQLLRVLETKDIHPIGATKSRSIDVRLIAATDSKLEQAVAAGRFRDALYHRLTGFQIHVPPLRERREDIPMLFYRFVRDELEELGAQALLTSTPEDRVWLPSAVVAQLYQYDWPGNVRQLKNVARQVVVSARHLHQVPDSLIQSLLGVAPPPSSVESPISESAGSAPAGAAAPTRDDLAGDTTYRDPSDITEDELLHALRSHQFRVAPAAKALAVSRSSMYALMEQSTKVRKAADLSKEEIETALNAEGATLTAVAAQLEVSTHALKIRMKALGMTQTAK
ncbi:MAG: sigma-54 dependent transcriptional regulator [Myxococcota bacterium]